MLWLWCRLAAAAPIRPLAWEPPYAAGAALENTKIQKKKKKEEEKKGKKEKEGGRKKERKRRKEGKEKKEGKFSVWLAGNKSN